MIFLQTYKCLFKILFLSILFLACANSKEEAGEELFNQQCSSCHLLPNPKNLPKHLWRTSVLPEMGARMGFKDSLFSPFAGNSFEEQGLIIRSGVYSIPPQISKEEWVLLQDYIVNSAPESLAVIQHKSLAKGLKHFKQKSVNLDSLVGSSISFLNYTGHNGDIMVGTLSGGISKYDYKRNKVVGKENFYSPITWYNQRDSIKYITAVGNLNPSQMARGSVYRIKDELVLEIISDLHRPVHTSIYDLDEDGNDEIIVSEFGHLTGSLSLWNNSNTSPTYKKQILIGQPGIIKTVVKDMNNDGKPDIVALSSQGNEGISILYQTDNLKFRTQQVIRFSPVYGTSWFEIFDYDGDGHDDIITAHGDNADNTYVHKPYHGIRIHLNDGNNNFKEKYFYPMYGATRFVANDFDNDGDFDIAVVSSFPDYENALDYSFVYLENKDAKNFKFQSYGLKNATLGRWLLVDSGDFDNDGDLDIVLSSFSYYFSPVPKELHKNWKASDVDLLFIENTLY